MNTNSVKTIFSIMTPSQLARLLGITHRAASKRKEKKYFPSDWFELIIIATDEAVTYEQLYFDLYTYKHSIIPQVSRDKAIKMSQQLKSQKLNGVKFLNLKPKKRLNHEHS